MQHISGDLQNNKALAQLTPPSSSLVFITKEDIHSQVVEHVKGLANAEIVWSVKKNGSNEVTPCGLAMVASKQFICSAGSNIVS